MAVDLDWNVWYGWHVPYGPYVRAVRTGVIFDARTYGPYVRAVSPSRTYGPDVRVVCMKNSPILMKFGTLHQILNPVTVTWPTIEIFKIQDCGGRHLENRFFGHKSLTDCPISAKFYMRKQNGRSTRATGQKLQIFSIQHGERPPFWKS